MEVTPISVEWYHYWWPAVRRRLDQHGGRETIDLQQNTCSRVCPICGTDTALQVDAEADFKQEALTEFAFASRKMLEPMHYRLLICSRCDMLFASPVPMMDSIAVAYDQAAFGSGEEAAYAARTYASFLPEITRNLPDREEALDIGTGDGAFLEQLSSHSSARLSAWNPLRRQSPQQSRTFARLSATDCSDRETFRANSSD